MALLKVNECGRRRGRERERVEHECHPLAHARSHGRFKFCVLLLAVFFSVGASSPPAIVSTQAVYAAFTLNLTRFVTWPAIAFATPEAPLVIGTYPRDLINDELDAAVRGESIGGHRVTTLRIRSLDDVAKCHVIFMSKATPRQAAVLERCDGKPILTIGDADGFLELGGHVRFVQQGTHIRLSINATKLRASGLEARAQLLRIAAAP